MSQVTAPVTKSCPADVVDAASDERNPVITTSHQHEHKHGEDDDTLAHLMSALMGGSYLQDDSNSDHQRLGCSTAMMPWHEAAPLPLSAKEQGSDASEMILRRLHDERAESSRLYPSSFHSTV